MFGSEEKRKIMLMKKFNLDGKIFLKALDREKKKRLSGFWKATTYYDPYQMRMLAKTKKKVNIVIPI